MANLRQVKKASVGQDGVQSRRSPRRSFRHPVGILCGGTYRVMQALQIGEGGMLLEAPQEMKDRLSVHDLVVVTVLLPDGNHAIARAEVVYVMPPEGRRKEAVCGLEFTELALPVKRRIRNYVSLKTEEEAETDDNFGAST